MHLVNPCETNRNLNLEKPDKTILTFGNIEDWRPLRPFVGRLSTNSRRIDDQQAADKWETVGKSVIIVIRTVG